MPPQLFRMAPREIEKTPLPAHIARSRFVWINADLLLKENGQVRTLQPNTRFTFNLFPDVSYTGVIERVEKNGPDNYAWTGYLQDVENSSLFIIYTEGVFLIHVASPAGVYEVNWVENDLYQVVQIDQTKLPRE